MMAVAPAAAEEPIAMREITVEASRLDEYLPARTEIPRQELTGSNKSELPQVLNLVPGINVREGGRGEVRVDLRGFDQRATLYTLNGVPLYEPYNGIINLNLFPIDMLGKVVVARGPSSSLFGPNGMAGTVKMTTPLPQKPLSIAASTIWRNSDFWDARASAAVAQGGLTATVGGRYLTSPGFPLSGEFEDRPETRRRFENGGLRQNSDRDEKSGFADFSYAPSDQTHVHATFLGSDSEFGIPVSTTGFAPVFRRNDGQSLTHVQAGIDQRLRPGLGAAVALFYTEYSTKETQFDGPDFATPIITTKADGDEVGGIGRVTVDLAEWDSLSLGGQVRRAHAHLSDTVKGGLGNPDFVTTSAAFENAWFATDRITVLVGLSWDVQTGGGRSTESELDPQGGVSVDFGRFGISHAGIARKIRFPTLRELFDPLQGNPDLKAEKALTYEIGHRVGGERAFADVSLYRSDVTDLISSEGGGSTTPATNLDEAVLQGVEVGAAVRPIDLLQVEVNYTYLDATARSGSAGAFTDIQHKPVHRFNGILRLFLPERVRLRMEGQYSSSQLDRFGSNVTVPGYGLFNVQLSKAFGEHVDVFAGVDNVLDTDSEDKLGFPHSGRWEYAGLRLKY